VDSSLFVVRRLKFEYPDDFDANWAPHRPEFSCVANSISLAMPYLEPYVVKSVSKYLPEIEVLEDKIPTSGVASDVRMTDAGVAHMSKGTGTSDFPIGNKDDTRSVCDSRVGNDGEGLVSVPVIPTEVGFLSDRDKNMAEILYNQSSVSSKEVRKYLAQETQHHVQHQKFNNIIRNQYPKVSLVEKLMARTFKWFGNKRSKEFNLALSNFRNVCVFCGPLDCS